VHNSCELNLSALNIFTGLNGMGKSSILQSFLLLLQSNAEHILDKGLMLSGDLVAIKQFKDKKAEEQKGIEIEDVRIFYIERAEGKHESLVHPIPIGENGRIRNTPDGFFNRINKDLKYIIGF